jgi:8-oxo-dGTP diphosphatase
MLNIRPPAYLFCPFCGQPLAQKCEEGKLRGWCRACDWTYYPHAAASVTGVVQNAGRVLLVKRRHEPFAQCWMFPAGFIDFGEHPKEAMLRELQEETGLIATDAQLMGVHQSEDDPRQPGHFVFFFEIAASGDLASENEENEEIRWFDLHAAPKLSWKLHQFVLEQIQQQIRAQCGEPAQPFSFPG